MSREAWGDEGDIATRWEDTQLYADFHEIKNRFFKFMNENKDGLPTVEMKVQLEMVSHLLELAEEDITGKID